jgi:tight adherence protein C
VDEVSNLMNLMQQNTELLIMAGIFLSVVMFVMAGMLVFKGRDPVKRRLAGGRAEGEAQAAARADPVSLRRADEDHGSVAEALKPIAPHLLPTDQLELGAARKRMVQAGYYRASALTKYYVLRLILAVVLPGIALVVVPQVSAKMTWETVALLVALSGIVGLYLPTVWVTRKISSRQQQCRDGFPDALDMLLISVEAGLGLDAAINRVGAEIGAAYPVLGVHFQRVGAELRAGQSREAALRSMSDQIGIEEVGSLVTLLIQSDTLGTSIAQALRVHADDMRIKRMLKAEEKAHMLPVKMTVPLILGILPPLVIVILAPAIIRFMRVGGG